MHTSRNSETCASASQEARAPPEAPIRLLRTGLVRNELLAFLFLEGIPNGSCLLISVPEASLKECRPLHAGLAKEGKAAEASFP